MSMTSFFRRTPGEQDLKRAHEFLAELKDYLKIDQPGFYQRFSDLRRIKVDKKMHAALRHLGCTRKSFAKHRVLIVDDVFLHLEIVDDLTACDGFHFVFCEPSALRITESEPEAEEQTVRKLAS